METEVPVTVEENGISKSTDLQIPSLLQAVIGASPNGGINCYYFVEVNFANSWIRLAKTAETGEKITESFATKQEAEASIPRIKQEVEAEIVKQSPLVPVVLGYRVTRVVEAREILSQS